MYSEDPTMTMNQSADTTARRDDFSCGGGDEGGMVVRSGAPDTVEIDLGDNTSLIKSVSVETVVDLSLINSNACDDPL